MRYVSLFLLAVLTCIAGDERVALAGRWYSGDGTGYNIYLDLRADGTYEAAWHGCLGKYGSARGKWREVASQIVLTPSKEEEMMKGHLTALLVIEKKKETTLLRKEDAQHRENPVFGFRRQKAD